MLIQTRHLFSLGIMLGFLAISTLSATEDAEPADSSDEELWKQLNDADDKVRRQAVDELVRRGSRNRKQFIAIAVDVERGTSARGAAIEGAARLPHSSVTAALVTLLDDDDGEIRRLAADAISNKTPPEFAESVTGDLIRTLRDDHPAARSAKAQALGQVASLLEMNSVLRERAARHLLSSLFFTRDDRQLRDGILRGIEQLGESGINNLTGLLDGDQEERELGVSSFESLRSREAAEGLNWLLERPLFERLTTGQQTRLLAAYRNIQAEPPITADAVVSFLATHADAPLDVQIAGLETVAVVGAGELETAKELANALLQNDDETTRQRIMTSLGSARLLVSTRPDEIARVEQLLVANGDAERGRAVFLDKQRSQCVNCHKLQGVGGAVGPDLSKLHETLAVPKLIEAIVEPSKEIADGFTTWTVKTADGESHSGRKITDDGQVVVLRDAAGNDIRIPAAEIDSMKETKQSLMGDNDVSRVSFQDFIDLVAFLQNKEAQQDLKRQP